MKNPDQRQPGKTNNVKTIRMLLLILSVIGVSEAADAKQNRPVLDLEFSTGYRIDQLDWNIAGNIDGNNPNILSELSWEDLEITQFNTRGTVTLEHDNVPFGLKIMGKIGYGEIHSGRNQDSDYNGNNRTLEFSRSNNNADNGDVRDFSAGVGPVFTTRNSKFSTTPCIGYSYHEQNLTIRDGYQTIPATGPFAGLNSTYETKWYSGWLGVIMEFVPSANFTLHSTVELHAGTYEAEADWNLRTDFQHPVSFRHDADEASGVLVNLGFKAGARKLLFNINLNYQKWQAEDGVDKTYLSNGNIAITKLNEVNWESFSAMAGFTLRF